AGTIRSRIAAGDYRHVAATQRSESSKAHQNRCRRWELSGNIAVETERSEIDPPRAGLIRSPLTPQPVADAVFRNAAARGRGKGRYGQTADVLLRGDQKIAAILWIVRLVAGNGVIVVRETSAKHCSIGRTGSRGIENRVVST